MNTIKLLFLTAIISAIHIFQVNAQPEGTRIDGVIAIVGKNVVLFSELESQYLQAVMYGEKPSEELRCEILEELLMQNLLLNQAQFDSLEVGTSELENELERRIRYFIAQIGSREALEQYYNKSILEIKDEFRDLIKDQMLIQKMQQQITADVKVTPSEVRKYFQNLPEEDIPLIELEFQLAQIIIMPQVSDEEKQELRIKMTELRDRVLRGDDFGTLAVLYSEDPGSAKKRGELGFFGRGEMFPEFEAAAFKMQTPGEISPIVETKAGLHILQLIERRGELVNVRHILLMQKPGIESVQTARNKADSIYQLIQSESVSFEQAVELYSDEKNKKSSGLMVNPYTMDQKFLASHLDASVLFAVENVEIGNTSNVLSYKDELNNSGYRIIKVVHKVAPHVANLNDDYPYIQELALEAKKMEAMNKWIIEKKQQTFIQIFEPYIECNFTYDW